jgi:hypothetical protein
MDHARHPRVGLIKVPAAWVTLPARTTACGGATLSRRTRALVKHDDFDAIDRNGEGLACVSA